MRAKHLLMATALLSFMASCNDDMVNEVVNNEVQTPADEVVGANLLSNKASIVVSNGEANSRIAGDKWEQGDKVGLGWFNVAKDGITQPQTDFDGDQQDKKLYANHMFMYEDNIYHAYSNVYAGAHFAYLPYTYMSGVAEKVVTLDNTMDKSFEEERQNQNFWLSMKTMVGDKDVTPEGELRLELPMREVSNALTFELAAPAEFANNTVLKNIHINNVSLTAYDKQNKEAKVFYTKAVVNPHKLAKLSEYTNTDGTFKTDDINNYFKDVENLFSYNAQENVLTFNENEASSVLAVNITNKDVKLNGTQNVVMHTFPYAKPSTQRTALNENRPAFVRVSTKWGYFDFPSTSKSMEGVYAFMLNKLGKEENLGLSTRNNVGFTTKKNGALNLSEAKFNPTYNIYNEADWYQALAVVKALREVYPDNADFTKAEFTLCSTVTLNKEIMPSNLASDVAITVKQEGNDDALVLNADTYMPTNLKFYGASNIQQKWFEVVINEGVTVNVTKDVNVDAQFTNNGIINVAAGGKISTVSNTNGRINLEYGSFVYAHKGIIAYTMIQDTKPYMVNYLMHEKKDDVQKELASVNTLVVNSDITLDMADKYTFSGSEDPYRPVAPTTEGYDAKLLMNAHIELIGGQIIDSNASINGVATYSVKSINVLNGGLLKDVKVSDVVVNKGEFLVDASFIGYSLNKNTVEFKNFVNNAKTTFDVNAIINTLINNKSAHLIVNDNYMIHWRDKYDQNGTTTGKIEKTN